MSTNPQRATPLDPSSAGAEPLELTQDQISWTPEFQAASWSEGRAEERGAGGRQVLGGALIVIGALWLAYTAWLAGRTLTGQSLSSPALAQWVAVATGPLALLGLVWLMFGRTRRKEAERFTRSVVAMRAEARSLEGLLQVLVQRISDSRTDLAAVSSQLMQLGDEATGKLGGITRTFDTSSERLRRHGEALDRAAESARNDIAVLLDDLPKAEAAATAVAGQLQAIGGQSADRVRELDQQVTILTETTRSADEIIGEVTDRLAARLAEIEIAGTTAAARVGEADAAFGGTLDRLLDRTSTALDEIRGGIDAQSAAVGALVAQANAGIGRAGSEAAEALANHLDHANETIGGLASRVAEQERASQRMIAEIDRGLAMIDERFSTLAAQGDDRANRFLESLTRARTELDTLASQSSTQDNAINQLAERTAALRENIGLLSIDVRDELATAIGGVQGDTDRLTTSVGAVLPDVQAIRDAADAASERLSASGDQIASQRQRIGELAESIAQVERDAANLTAETGPALVTALVQVKEAAAHAADRAREAIESVIPAGAEKLSRETREALERVIHETVQQQLSLVETTATRAVEAARSASDRLTQQMLNIGQSAAALEQHMEQTSQEQREKDSEAFARRVSLLIDSMHSAAIDVGKILSDEIDDKAWDSYLKGNRGVFTRRAVRLLGGSEGRAIRAHYEADAEFHGSVNRYVHDFEAMLRRVLAEREGGMIAVTLMSSDMGKLYAALAQAIERKR